MEWREILRLSVLVFLVGWVSYTDLRWGRIPNRITFPAMAVGLGLGALYGWKGLLLSFVGMVAGFIFLLVPFYFDWVKAGDVKFLAAIGAIKGWPFVLWAWIYGTAIGGLVAASYLLRRRRLKRTLEKAAGMFITLMIFREGEFIADPKAGYFPYALALTLGALLALGLELWRGAAHPW